MMDVIFEDNEIAVYFISGSDRTIVFSFSPMNHNFSEKGVPALNALKTMGFSVIGVIAKRNNWYPYRSMVAASEEIKKRCLGHSVRLSYGSSMGAYGAVKYSSLLDCTHVLALGPQYSIDPADVGDWDNRFLRHYRNDLNVRMSVKSDDVSGKVFCVVDPYFYLDMRHYDYIRCISDSCLIPAYFCDHYVINPIANRQILAKLIASVVDGDILEAKRVYQEARKMSPYFRGSLLEYHAKRRMQQGHLETAVRSINRSIEQAPNISRFLVTKSRIHSKMGQLDEALTAALAAQKVEPASAWINGIVESARTNRDGSVC